MSERCPTCGATCTIEGKTTLHYRPMADVNQVSGIWPEKPELVLASDRQGYVPYEATLRALLREALEDQYAQHAPGCSGLLVEEWCACGFRKWRRRALEAIR